LGFQLAAVFLVERLEAAGRAALTAFAATMKLPTKRRCAKLSMPSG